VLDLGCGTGRDVFLLSQLVGEQGSAIGVDMTESQLAVAKEFTDWHTNRFGYTKPNVSFTQGYIEDLKSAGVKDNSCDIVISNCVINLSPDKKSVFKEIFRVLKPGGELYFSDVFSGRRIPRQLQEDKVLYGECLSGAMYLEDFRRMLQEVGCADYRIVSKSQLTLEDEAIAQKAGMIDFHSITVRAFKLKLEDRCENYGHVVRYKGTIAECPHSFILDDHHEFKTGMPVTVCGNTARMLSETRLANHFEVFGDFSVHYGLFNCASGLVSEVTISDCNLVEPCC